MNTRHSRMCVCSLIALVLVTLMAACTSPRPHQPPVLQRRQCHYPHSPQSYGDASAPTAPGSRSRCGPLR